MKNDKGPRLSAARLRIVGGTAAAPPTLPLPSGVPRGRPWGKAYLDELKALKIPPVARLLYVLRCCSFRGRKTLTLDTEIAVEAGLDSRNRSHYARRLEKLGLLRLESIGRRTLRVRIL